MNYIVKVLSSGQKYIFVLLVLLILSACSVSICSNRNENYTISYCFNYNTQTLKANIEKIYGGQAIVFKPEAGFAILGFTEGQLTTLTTDPNAAVATPAVSIAGVNAWGGGEECLGRWPKCLGRR